MVKGNDRDGYQDEPGRLDEEDLARNEDGTPNWSPIIAYPRFDDSGRIVDENCKFKLSKKAAKEHGRNYGWNWQHCGGGEHRMPDGRQLQAEYATNHGHMSETFRHKGQAKGCEDCRSLIALGKLPSDWQEDSYWYFGGNVTRLRSKGEHWSEVGLAQYEGLLDTPVIAICEGQSDADAVWEFFGIPAITHCYAKNGPTREQAHRLKGFKGQIWLFADRDRVPENGKLPGLVAAEKTLQMLLYPYGNGRGLLKANQFYVYLPPEDSEHKDVRDWLEDSDWVPGGEERPDLKELEGIPGEKFRSYVAEEHRKIEVEAKKQETAEFQDAIEKQGTYESYLISKLKHYGGGGYRQFFFDKDDDQDGLKVPRLADAVQSAGPIKTGPAETVYMYREGLWQPGGEREVKNRARLLLGDKFSRGYVADAAEWFRLQEPTLTDEAINTDYINCKNGLLNWRTGEFQPHDPEIYVPNQIPVEWHPDATCPNYDKWLEQVVEEDSIELMHELHGYAMLNDNPLHKAAMFHGTGRNGKGTELRLLRKLLGGSANISSCSPQELDGDRFAVVETYRKLANIVGDVDARMFEGTEVFKKMTGQDVIRGQRKNGQPFDFMCRALMIASFNEYPRTSDHSEGFWSRWIVIPFTKGYFPDKIKDPRVEERISTKEELEGIFVKAITGLQRIIANNAFSTGESSEKAAEEFQRESDVLQLFVEDAITLKKGGKGLLRRSEIKTAFNTWIKNHGHRQQVTSSQKYWARFRKALEKAHGMDPDMVKAIESGRHGYIGLKLLIDAGTGMRLDEEAEK